MYLLCTEDVLENKAHNLFSSLMEEDGCAYTFHTMCINKSLVPVLFDSKTFNKICIEFSMNILQGLEK